MLCKGVKYSPKSCQFVSNLLWRFESIDALVSRIQRPREKRAHRGGLDRHSFERAWTRGFLRRHRSQETQERIQLPPGWNFALLEPFVEIATLCTPCPLIEKTHRPQIACQS